ncbi:tyrosine-protein phosphatase [Nocardiopsis deserti]|uniref:tyrosine-protein phosphatase n=1 Tax=Nocardiopsis deserti TaxID=2605988 RepID=UPI00123926F8|nr:tyrosine-protein phosphatase [Nocardiopsis deserti]
MSTTSPEKPALPAEAPYLPVSVEPSVPVNFRDLGGVAVHGGRIRPGLVFRSDDLATATPDFVRSACRERGIGHLIDLRSPGEVASTGRGPFADREVTGHTVDYHHITLSVDLTPGGRDLASLPTTPEGVAAFYADMADRSAASLATILTLLAFTDRPAVFHCAAGKDRTGVLAALLLGAVGAGEDAVVEDYARTDAAMPGINRRLAHLMGPLLAELGTDTAAPGNPMMRADAETMRAFWRTMTRRHGDPLGGLRAAGLDGDVVQRLRGRLVQDA